MYSIVRPAVAGVTVGQQGFALSGQVPISSASPRSDAATMIICDV
jgi:hypothetical protein